MSKLHQDQEYHRLRQVVSKVRYGELKLVIQNGRITRVEHVVQQIKLDDVESFKEGLDTIALG